MAPPEQPQAHGARGVRVTPLWQRQAGGGRVIECEWCHFPATFVWSNRDPGIVDDNADVNPYWPIDVGPVTPVCRRCDMFIEAGELVELMDRAIKLWIRDFGGEPNREGWREQTWQTMSARLAAWLARRDAVGEIPWEDVDDDDGPPAAA